MPEQYYRDWLKVASEEAYHFTPLSDNLKTIGYAYSEAIADDPYGKIETAKPRPALSKRRSFVHSASHR